MTIAAIVALIVAIGALYYIRQDSEKYAEVERDLLVKMLEDMREAATEITALNSSLYGNLITDLLRDIALLEDVLGMGYDR